MVTVGSIATRVMERLQVVATADAPVDEQERRFALPARRIVSQATAMWVASRIVFALITFMVPRLPLSPNQVDLAGVFPTREADWHLLLPQASAHWSWTIWLHWDAAWYLLIGTHGYDVATPTSSGFFPLYPLAIHLVSLVVGARHALLVAIALSNLATLGAFIGLGLLAAHEERSEEAAWRLILVTAAFPFAFFLFAPFTEGLFLCLVVFSFFFARRGSWWAAATIAFLAGLSRPTGVLLALPLVWEYGRQQGWWQLRRWRGGTVRSTLHELLHVRAVARGAVVALAAPLGLGAYLLFLQVRYGNGMLPFQAQDTFHGHVHWPIWRTIGELAHRFLHQPPAASDRILLFVDGGIMVAILVLTVVCIRRLPLMYTLYMLGTLYLLLTIPVESRAELVQSTGRYMLMAVPIFLLFARWMARRPWLEMLLIGGGFMLQAIFTVAFLNGHWIE